MDVQLIKREKIKGTIGSGDCFLIQAQGFAACVTCEQRNKDQCGGGQVLLYKIITEIGGTSPIASHVWQQAWDKHSEEKNIVQITQDLIKNPEPVWIPIDQIKSAWNGYLVQTKEKDSSEEWKVICGDDPFGYESIFYKYNDDLWQILQIEGRDYLADSGIIENNYTTAILVSEGVLDIDSLLSNLNGVMSSMSSDLLDEYFKKKFFTKKYIKKNPMADSTLFLIAETFRYGIGRTTDELHKEHDLVSEYNDHKEWFIDNYGFDPEEIK